MSDKYWQKQKGLSLFIPSLEKKPDRTSELVLTVLRRWTSIFSRLEKIEPLCRPSGQLVAPYAAQGGIS
ncbi:hypothetical protein X737_02075 [Mesorhizobium sp. L48C026A00]|nr:hypothetical protein X737_02075 [Mesorhizobium sp. L48C026A00]